MGAEKNSRRALGDIGNVVKPQVSRPATRSFCAQLLANAQAAADKNNKDSLAVNPNGGPIVADGVLLPKKKAAAVRKPTLKKAVDKSNKPQEIIEISPDTVEKQNAAAKCSEKCHDKSGKKRGPTLTSTLTARSKAACGLSKDEQIADVDAADSNNHLAVVEYVEEMYNFYKMVENEGHAHGYMKSQPEINEKMRAILIDWLIQVHGKFDLSTETLYLAINILDRYLASTTATSRRDLQLVGLSSLLIASKYEEIWPPQVDELACISDRTYSNEQILVMEKRILGSLEWYLTVPTPYVFLVRFIKVSQTDSDVENMVYFLAELGMMNYATLVHCPSMIAASAVYAARCTLNKTPLWNRTLEVHTGFTESQLLDCAKLLVTYHCSSMAADHKLKGAYRKYLSSDKGAVALLPPAKSLLLAQ